MSASVSPHPGTSCTTNNVLMQGGSVLILGSIALTQGGIVLMQDGSVLTWGGSVLMQVLFLTGLNLMSQFNVDNVTIFNTKAEEYNQARKQVGCRFPAQWLDTVTRFYTDDLPSGVMMQEDPLYFPRLQWKWRFMRKSPWWELCSWGATIRCLSFCGHCTLWCRSCSSSKLHPTSASHF